MTATVHPTPAVPVSTSVTDVNASTADGAYGAGSTVTLTLDFSAFVTVDTVGGTPTLALDSGGTATYTGGSGTTTLTFSYTVGAGQNSADLDAASTSALSLNGATITDSGDRNAALTLPTPGAAGSLGANKDIVIDTVAPTNYATGMAFSADTGSLSNDFVTRTAAQTISGTLAANLATDEHVYVSLDGGASWALAAASGNSWSLAGQTLTGSGTLEVRVSDDAGNVGSVVSKNYVLDQSAPTTTFASLALSADTGVSHSDFITNTAAQTISATLSAAPNAGDVVYGSLDGGATWTDITSKVSGTTLAWNGVTLAASGTLELRVADLAGNTGASTIQNYVLDTTAPSTTVASVAFSHDSGASSTDFITNAAAQTVSGTLSANLAAGEAVYVSLDNGATWQAANTAVGSNAWALSGQTLVASDTLQVKVTDTAGNDSAILSQAYVYQASAPTITFGALALAFDTGIAGDFITNTAAQTVSATLSHALGAGDTVWASLDGGAVWTDISSFVSGTTLSWTGVTLAGSSTLSLKVTDLAGNDGAVRSQAYTLDSTAPAAPGTPALAAGGSSTDVAAPVIDGSAEAGATVTLYDSDGVTVLGTATADGSGNWRITSSALAPGHHTLSATQTDVAGNVSTVSATLALDIVAPAAPPTSPSPPLVDGVPVTTAAAALPGGGSGILVTVPIVAAGEGGATGAANVADIPLVSVGGSTVLLAQVPVGDGLTSLGGASEPAGGSLAGLIAAIDARTASHPAADQAHLGGNGEQFIGLLDAGVPLLLNTVQLRDNGSAAAVPLTLTGTSSSTQHTALVIDASALTPGSSIVLHAVDFAAVVGAVTVTGDTAGQIITGDQASQHFIVATAGATEVYAGGGDDNLQFAPPAASAGASLAAVSHAAHALASSSAELGAPTAVYLDGGTGDDTATFAKAQSAYTIDQHDGYVLVTDTSAPASAVTLTNVEHLAFADASVDVVSRAELSTIAGLYESVLGRQPEIAGFDFWGAQQSSGRATMGDIALGFINSVEAAKLGLGMNGDATHDVTMLYQALFNRAPDAAGLAFWVGAMQHGETLSAVANAFVTAPEIVGHQLAVTAWDLHF